MTMYVAPKRVSGRVVKIFSGCSDPFAAIAVKVTSAPSDRPIQLVCIALTFSGQSSFSSPFSRRSAYFVIRSIHWLSSFLVTSVPQRSHRPLTTSSLAIPVLQLGHQFTGMKVLYASAALHIFTKIHCVHL